MTIRKLLLTGWAVALVGLLASVGAVAGTAKPASAQVDLVEIFQQHIDARNAGDVDAALALLTEDAVVQGAVGKEAIRAKPTPRPTLPATGIAGLIDGRESGIATWWYALAAGGALLLTASFAIQWRARSRR